MASANFVRGFKWLANATGALLGYQGGDGSDVELWKKGAIASRPAASVYNVGAEYFADDEDGGTLYRNYTGIGWTKIAVLAAEVTYTASLWADRGTGSFVGQIKRFTDIGNIVNVFGVWNGTHWRPFSGRQPLYNLAGTLLGTNANPSVITLPAVTIPGGLMGINGGIDIEFQSSITDGTATTANVPSYTFGGFELFGTDATTLRRLWYGRRIRNENSATVQTVMAAAGSTGAYVALANDPKATSKNTAADVALAGTVTATTGGNHTAQLDEFKIWWV